MGLVKSWLKQALRATGAAIVVPIAILVALSLNAVGGTGLSGPGGLSQVLSGPQAAGSDLPVDDGDFEIAGAVAALGAAAATSVTAATGGAGGTSPADRPSPGGPDGPRSTPPADDPAPQPPAGRPRQPDNGDPRPPVQPPPPPPPPTGTVEGTGRDVKEITAGTPVAPTVEDAVDGLVETCRQLRCP